MPNIVNPNMLDTAISYVKNGRSVKDIRKGTKVPNGKWKVYQQRKPTIGELEVWFRERFAGICIITGGISGGELPDGTKLGLEVLDCDDADTALAYVELAQKTGIGDLLASLPTERTPGGGQHWGWLCSDWEGNIKLALQNIETDGKSNLKSILETRGEGGQCVVSPTPSGIHPLHPERGYDMMNGSWCDIPIISPTQRGQLLDLARTFNEYVDKKEYGFKADEDRGRTVAGERPGDRLNQIADRGWWKSLLEKHGWKYLFQHNNVDHWQRPGKDKRDHGASATYGRTGDKFYVFTSSAAPFEPSRAYSAFTASTFLDFNGNFRTATRYWAQHFGIKKSPSKKKPPPPIPAIFLEKERKGGSQEPNAEDDDPTLAEQIHWTGKMKPMCDISNINLILKRKSPWKNLYWLDEVRNLPMVGEDPLTPSLIMKIAQWLGIHALMSISNPRIVSQCVEMLCAEHPRDLLREWLDNLPVWDQVPRLDTWFSSVADTDVSAYTTAISRIIPLSMIARVMEPGCLFRYVVILEGPEGSGKSTLVRALTNGEWNVDLALGLESKDAHMMLQGAWVAEMPELDALSRTAEAKLKAFITATTDSYIPKYSNLRVSYPRRTIFIGTTNDASYLKGQTGNTRYLPVKTGEVINVGQFKEIRHQLFAEAVQVYHQAPDAWWQLQDGALEQAKEEREERRVLNVYEDRIHEWLDEWAEKTAEDDKIRDVKRIFYGVSLQQVMGECLNLSEATWIMYGVSQRASEAMRSKGWETITVKEPITDSVNSEKRVVRRWVPPKAIRWQGRTL